MDRREREDKCGGVGWRRGTGERDADGLGNWVQKAWEQVRSRVRKRKVEDAFVRSFFQSRLSRFVIVVHAS